jgi:redox-sensing transcriptional repressor
MPSAHKRRPLGSDSLNRPSAEPLGAPDRTYGGNKIPKAVIKRLSLYARALKLLSVNRLDKVSSRDLGEVLGINPAQVRKDLAYFGQFGVPGFGYYVEDLRRQIKAILGTDRIVRLALIGVGNLGQALLSYAPFRQEGFHFIAAFDADKRKVGGDRAGVPIYHSDELPQRLRTLGIDLVILAVPTTAAQGLADTVVESGIHAILNFVPVRLVIPPYVKVHYVDLTIEIESLSYYLK